MTGIRFCNRHFIILNGWVFFNHYLVFLKEFSNYFYFTLIWILDVSLSIYKIHTTLFLFSDNKLIQMRTGIQMSDISGKSWKTISARAPFQCGGGRYRSISESSRKTRHSSDSSSFTCSSSCDKTDTVSTSSEMNPMETGSSKTQQTLSEETKGKKEKNFSCKKKILWLYLT